MHVRSSTATFVSSAVAARLAATQALLASGRATNLCPTITSQHAQMHGSNTILTAQRRRSALPPLSPVPGKRANLRDSRVMITSCNSSPANCPEILPANGQPGHHTEDDFGAACVSMAFRDSKWLRTEHSTTSGLKYSIQHSLVTYSPLMAAHDHRARRSQLSRDARARAARIPAGSRVLIIGGGDGGTVTQVAQHTNLREIVWAELDESRQTLP